MKFFRLGSQVNYQNAVNKFTPLHYAVMGSNREAIQMLLDAGADINIRNSDVCFHSLRSFEYYMYEFFFQNETPYDLAAKHPAFRHLLPILSPDQFSKPNLSKWLQFNKSNRRLGTKLLPYLIILLVGCIFQLNISWIYKGVLIIFLILLTKGYIM